MDLFSTPAPPTVTAPRPAAHAPLADRLRPLLLADVVGQEHLTTAGGPIDAMVKAGRATSTILWGPPGSGKTTMARLLAGLFGLRYVQMSAIGTGVADLKRTFTEAHGRIDAGGTPTLLFIDEIHRFNKAQQDGFLPHMEDGTIVLVGATTENPSFELNDALLSRSQVLRLNAHDAASLAMVMARAEADTGPLPITQEARTLLIANASGDARHLLGQIEVLTGMHPDQPLDVAQVERVLARRLAGHDRAGDAHYNLASAFQKAIRGSDPDAALYYAARMVDAGEAVAFIFRRLIVTASEEVGMADPTALATVIAARHAVDMLGIDEGGYALSQAIIHVATAPKSNAAYKAWSAALELARGTRGIDPPKRILNAPTKLMRSMGYKDGYVYDHDAEGAFSGQDFWPDDVGRTRLYEPTPRGLEARIGERIRHWDALRGEKTTDE